jgi:hypothetical protein
VPIGWRTADVGNVRTRKSEDNGDLEGWITGLTDGEPTARQLRSRLTETGKMPAASCTVCSADESYFGPGGHLHGHLHGRRSA